MLNFLRREGIDPGIIGEVQAFRNKYPTAEELTGRVPVPRYLYYGREVWEEAITALLSGENLLLVGPKATGKNVLAENLAAAFGRPSWDVSFYINTDAATLLGTDTFHDNRVTLRKGPIYQCAEFGGFGVLDEINMAKNESLAVLHATLDFRRSIDMPAITQEGLVKLLRREFPDLRNNYAEQFAGLFQDLQKKCDGGELSTKPLDLRGLLAAVRLMHTGLEGNRALEMGLVNKSFDDFERQLVKDVIQTRLPEEIAYGDVFA